MTWIKSAVAARRYPVSSNARSGCAVGETTSAINWRNPSSIASCLNHVRSVDRRSGYGQYMGWKISASNPCLFRYALRLGNLSLRQGGGLTRHDELRG